VTVAGATADASGTDPGQWARIVEPLPFETTHLEEEPMSPDRHAPTMLPISDRSPFGLTTYDAKDPETSFPPIEPLVPAQGAPNVLLSLLDDAGFGAASTFGGTCRTPTADRLAASGLRYNRFHTTALLRRNELCALTRAALLSGRNHNSMLARMIMTTSSARGNGSGKPCPGSRSSWEVEQSDH
jgi:hypothetical protein